MVVLVARGDDDESGRADWLESSLGPGALERSPQLPKGRLAPRARAPSVGPLRWVMDGGRVLPGAKELSDEAPGASRIFLLGQAPGRGVVHEAAGLRDVYVVDVRAFDGSGREIDRARSWASLVRSLPNELVGGEARVDTESEVSFLLVGPAAALPAHVELLSLAPNGRYRDSLPRVRLEPASCPADVGEGELVCRRTQPIRLVGDAVDRSHPSTIERALVAEVGGRVLLQVTEGARASLWVGGPRELEVAGPGRYRAQLRARILRTRPGGPPAVGNSDAEARELVLAEIATANQIWGQCGIHFGEPGDVDVQIVDPPQTALVAVGCDAGLPASGGEIALSVEGRSLRLRTSPGQSPELVAGRLAEMLAERGYEVSRQRNPKTEHSALPTVDVGARDRKGRWVPLRAERSGEISSDPSLRVCPLEVVLEDGLDHFSDGDSASGTLEERALLRTLLDARPGTIDLLVVPVFSGLGRIGESFIWNPGASLQNALILDRGGIRASLRSFTLSHELGHILLDMPGHPDDYGVDQPNSLMDADASDGTIFGPRRLSLDDCQRALRQSGPQVPVPLLQPWPRQHTGGAATTASAGPAAASPAASPASPPSSPSQTAPLKVRRAVP
ncbi:MAG TPA: hypothetical protein VLC09_00625 [Polyangiaceae bacterium]|nr:hypothetical protein [Polyangiaceae bacterium]